MTGHINDLEPTPVATAIMGMEMQPDRYNVVGYTRNLSRDTLEEAEHARVRVVIGYGNHVSTEELADAILDALAAFHETVRAQRTYRPTDACDLCAGFGWVRDGHGVQLDCPMCIPTPHELLDEMADEHGWQINPAPSRDFTVYRLTALPYAVMVWWCNNGRDVAWAQLHTTDGRGTTTGTGNLGQGDTARAATARLLGATQGCQSCPEPSPDPTECPVCRDDRFVPTAEFTALVAAAALPTDREDPK